MFCKKCGNELDDGTSFCPHCGAQQNEVPAETQAEPQPQPAYQQTPPPSAQPAQQFAQQQPVAPTPASEQEKSAYFKSAGSVLMLVVCMIATVSLVLGIVAPLLSFQLLNFIFGLIGSILTILILIGMWIAWSNAKKKTLNPNGIKLIRIPYVIQFVFTVIGFAVIFIMDIVAIAGVNVIGEASDAEAGAAVATTVLVFALFQSAIPFIFNCIVFASLNKTLKVAESINNNVSVMGQKASKTLGIILIIFAAVNAILGIVGFILNPLAVMSLISTLIQAIYWIIGAVVLLGFAKNLNIAHGQL